jgi:serine/threonine protein kinase
MDAGHWQKVKDLFNQLASLPPDEQMRAIQELEADPAGIREEVERLLLHAQRGTHMILDRPAIDLIEVAPADEPRRLGRFDIVRRLGSGGMGIVYEAFDPLRGTRVALKALIQVTPASIALFKQEFRSLADIHHSHLVTLYDLFEDDRRWFLTMEFVDGLPLAAWLDAATDRWRAVRHAFAGLADGLTALHRVGKLHRDLKPSNVLVTGDERVVILDFGLVIEAADPGTPILAGTPRYMSPEQAAGKPLTTASDCYTLGLVLLEALTGALPESILRHRANAPPSPLPPSRFGAVPADLAALCTALTRLAPEDRPKARQVLALLRGELLTATVASRFTPTTTGRPLIGRDGELRGIADAIDEDQSVPIVAGIEGPSGIGKTALVSYALEAVRPQPATILLRSRCYEREMISFNMFDSLSEALSIELRRRDRASLEKVLPPDAQVLGRMFSRLAWLSGMGTPSAPVLDRQQLRRTGGRVLQELLRNLSDQCRIVIFVDDAQWSDLDSAEMLLELLSGPSPPPLRVLLAFRSEERHRSGGLSHILAKVVDLPCVVYRPLVLRPLEPDAAMQLAHTLQPLQGVHQISRDEANRIARESGGNPFFIGELVQYALRVERQPTGAGADDLTLGAVIRARAQQLPEAAQQLLETVAIASRPIRSADALIAASETGVSPSPTWLSLLRTDRFVRTVVTSDGEFVEPFHDRLRETIAESLDAERRRQRHRALAATLERSAAAEPDVLATHYEGAGDLERAGRYYVTAAEQASAALAFHNAAARYQKALTLHTWPTGHRLDLERARAEALANAGHAFEAAQAFEAASTDRSPAALTSLSRAGYHYAASGRITEAKQAFATVNAQLGIRIPLEPRFTLPRLLALKTWLSIRRYRFRERSADAITQLERSRVDACWFVGAGLGLVELITGALFTTHALRMALRSGDASRIARSLTWEAATAASQSRRGKAQARVLFEVCREIVDRLQDPYCTAMLTLGEGLADFSHGRWASARQRFERAQQIFARDCVGVTYELATLNGFKLQTCVYSGAYAELRTLTPALLDGARVTNDLYSETFIRGAIMPLIHLADDRPDLARDSVGVALRSWTSPGYHLQHALIDQVRFCIELYEGRAVDAAALVGKQWTLLEKSGLLFNQNLRAKLLELRAKCRVAVALSTPDSASPGAAAKSIDRLEREHEPCFQGSVLSLRSALAHSAGHASAETLMAQATAAYHECGMHDYSAAAGYWLATWRSDRDGVARRCDWMNQQGIQNPLRWARMRAPALAASRTRS